mgnify:FL=1
MKFPRPYSFVCVALLLAFAGVVRATSPTDCSGNGILYPDEDHCECFQCFDGPSCQDSLTNCTINAGGGNPAVFQDYWWYHDATTVTPSWYRPEYQIDLPWFPGKTAPGIGEELRNEILMLHQSVGNVETKGYSIVLGSGCTHLIAAASSALASVHRNATVFAKAPYYDGYASWAELGVYGMSFSKSLDLEDSDGIIEFVTTPNNPTGEHRQAHYHLSHVVGDMVYNWPSLTNVTDHADWDIMMFSLSKLSGHAGTRMGWALVKDPKVASLMEHFIGTNQIHISIDAQWRTLHVLKAINSKNGDFFQWAQRKMAQRWSDVLALFEESATASSSFVLHSVPGQFYLWIQCLESNDCAGVFAKAGLQGWAGSLFGVDDSFVRIELMEHDKVFALILEKLKQVLTE